MDCIDLHGRSIGQEHHFVPGPDACTLCICDNGSPKWCKAVLCSPPQDCKSFRVGNSCCQFICLDDTLGKGDSEHDFNADLGLRLIATAITAILSLSLLFFLIHRLRQRKIRGRQNRELSCEVDRSLGSIGYIGGSLGYIGDGDFEEVTIGNFPLWKPAGYFTRGEAPPPYEEAVAAARAEAALSRINPGPSVISAVQSSQHHRTIPVNLATSAALVLPPPPIPELPEEPPPHQPSPQQTNSTPPPAQSEGDKRPRKTATPVAPPIVAPGDTGAVNPPPVLTNTVPTPLAIVSGGSEEAEDYRSECENCQMSANQGHQEEGEYCADLRTMTLQRKNATPYDNQQQPNFYRTSLTLPTQVSKHRILGGGAGGGGSCARENWFSSMPETSSSDEDE